MLFFLFFHRKASETFYLTTREALRTITVKVNEATGAGGSAPWPDTRQTNTGRSRAVLTPAPRTPHPTLLPTSTGTGQVLLQSRRWMQRPPRSRGGGKARPGRPLLPPSAPRAGPGAAAGAAPAGQPLPDAPQPPSATHTSRAARRALPAGGYRCPRRRPGRPAPL